MLDVIDMAHDFGAQNARLTFKENNVSFHLQNLDQKITQDFMTRVELDNKKSTVTLEELTNLKTVHQETNFTKSLIRTNSQRSSSRESGLLQLSGHLSSLKPERERHPQLYSLFENTPGGNIKF